MEDDTTTKNVVLSCKGNDALTISDEMREKLKFVSNGIPDGILGLHIVEIPSP